MSTIKITGQSRDAFGKGAARQTRRAGLIPAVVYGSGSAVTHVALPERELMLALRHARVVLEVEVNGKKFVVAPRDVQRDPVRRTIEHLDLITIDRAEVKSRNAEAKAIEAAEAAAAEAGQDPIAAAHMVDEAIAHGESAADAASHAVSDLEDAAEAFADAADYEAEHEAIEASEDPAVEPVVED